MSKQLIILWNKGKKKKVGKGWLYGQEKYVEELKK